MAVPPFLGSLPRRLKGGGGTPPDPCEGLLDAAQASGGVPGDASDTCCRRERRAAESLGGAVVAVMEPAQIRRGDDLPLFDRLYVAWRRRVVVQGLIRPRLVVVADVLGSRCGFPYLPSACHLEDLVLADTVRMCRMLSPPNGITEMQQIIDAFKIVYDHIYDLRNAAEGELVEEKKLVL